MSHVSSHAKNVRHPHNVRIVQLGIICCRLVVDVLRFVLRGIFLIMQPWCVSHVMGPSVGLALGRRTTVPNVLRVTILTAICQHVPSHAQQAPTLMTSTCNAGNVNSPATCATSVPASPA